ncbi:hypothetical protein PMAYCL1PPCAC_32563, partial [Pristionchus mayeri]
MLLLLILPLFSSSRADFASDHVHNFLNESVAPCDNFYRHVCSMGMGVNDTVAKKSAKYYQDMASRLQSRSANNPIMNDIAEARADLNCTFDDDVYSNLLQERCASDFDCYFDEFLYFFKLFNKTKENVDDSLKYYSTHGNKTSRSIQQSVRATSKMVELLYQNSDFNKTKSFNSSVSTYVLLNDRLFVMEVLNANDTASRVGLEKVHNLTKQIRDIIRNTFQETPWMRRANEFGFTILGQYLEILDELTILTDFDCLDRNLTTLRRINHDMTERYFENSPRRTGCTWFDVVHAFNTTDMQLDAKYTSYEDQVNYFRVATTFSYNAFNFVEASIIAILGPTFYPLVENSTETTQIAFAGDIIGHEMYHSFITEALPNRSEEYRNEADCLTQHYNQSCQLFAEGECNSGPKTLSEDGPDVEGLRAAFELLKKEYTDEQLKEFDYPDLKITREQNFFYSAAMRSCADIANGVYREHSPDNIRVNALYSQMPEFTRAFGCKPDDLLYSEEDRVCYLFGKKSTGKNANSTINELKKTKGPAALDSIDNL